MEDRWHVVYGGQVACSVWRTGGMQSHSCGIVLSELNQYSTCVSLPVKAIRDGVAIGWVWDRTRWHVLMYTTVTLISHLALSHHVHGCN